MKTSDNFKVGAIAIYIFTLLNELTNLPEGRKQYFNTENNWSEF